MNIYGEKTVLRALELEDNKILLEMVNDPDTERMLGGSSSPVSASGQIKWYERQENRGDILRLAIAPKDDPKKALGTIILSDIDLRNGVAQIHIKLSDDNARRKGYGTDAVQALVFYAFNEMRLNCIYAQILAYNTASLALFEKCGFKKEGILRQRVFKNGEYQDILEYSILSSEVKP